MAKCKWSSDDELEELSQRLSAPWTAFLHLRVQELYGVGPNGFLLGSMARFGDFQAGLLLANPVGMAKRGVTVASGAAEVAMVSGPIRRALLHVSATAPAYLRLSSDTAQRIEVVVDNDGSPMLAVMGDEDRPKALLGAPPDGGPISMQLSTARVSIC